MAEILAMAKMPMMEMMEMMAAFQVGSSHHLDPSQDLVRGACLLRHPLLHARLWQSGRQHLRLLHPRP
jgi:hypothetical protein